MSSQAFAETSLWKISKGDSRLFIGGTIHVLGMDDYPLPKEFEQAYKQSQIVVFETDMTAMIRPEAQKQLFQRVTYKPGKTLKDDLNAKTYKALLDYSSSVGLKIESLDRLKPPMVMITLLMAELKRLGIAETGVDQYFFNKAQVDGKTLSELENLQMHLTIIENMGKGHEDEMILGTIEEMKELPIIMGKMKKAWKTGNIEQLEKIGITPMITNYPSLYRQLLVKRNNAWVPQIEALLTTPEVEFVLVGALHLVATEGVISKLRSKGYQVELF
jgi:uncharacterized protein YbaP (TraB family)